MFIDNAELSELIADENQPKTRVKKINPKIKQYTQESRKDLKLSRLAILEEDDDYFMKEE